MCGECGHCRPTTPTGSRPARSVAVTSSLFPEQYPPKPAKRSRKKVDPSVECCDEWERFVAYRAENHLGVHPIWRMVHRFAHGRLPFSVDVLAGTASSTPSNAEAVIAGAVDAEWIVAVQPEFEGQLVVPLWMGRLERRGK